MVTALICLTPVVNQAQSNESESTSAVKAESPKKFIKDLRRFIRSVNNESYQPEGYWDQVDKLWEALQVRKDNLENSFSESERDTIEKLERKYQAVRKKKTKLS